LDDDRQKTRREAVRVSALTVLERDNWICQLCGLEAPKELRGFIHPRAPEVGHVIPVNADGPDDLSNLRCECRGCNSFKGDLTDKELLAELMQRVADERLTLRPIKHRRMGEAMRAAAKKNRTKLGRPASKIKCEQVVKAIAETGSLRKAAWKLNISYGLTRKLLQKSKLSSSAR
jgi:5-methylcytosine-specific restriction endonuclease McrA